MSIITNNEKMQGNPPSPKTIKLISSEYKRYGLEKVIRMEDLFLLPSGDQAKSVLPELSWRINSNNYYGGLIAGFLADPVFCVRNSLPKFFRIINFSIQSIQIRFFLRVLYRFVKTYSIEYLKLTVV